MWEKVADLNLPEGVKRGIAGMCPGERRRVVIPPLLGFGIYQVQSHGFVPSDAVLVYDLELRAVKVPLQFAAEDDAL